MTEPPGSHEPAEISSVAGPFWGRASTLIREATPLIAIVLTAFSSYIAYVSFTEARTVSREQAESSEPILVPGTPLNERGKTIGVTTEYALFASAPIVSIWTGSQAASSFPCATEAVGSRSRSGCRWSSRPAATNPGRSPARLRSGRRSGAMSCPPDSPINWTTSPVRTPTSMER
jgi:hypothetical protein